MKSLKTALLMTANACTQAVSAAATPSSDPSVPGEILVEPPTLQSLGIEWPLIGDANRNASVSIRFRRKGTDTWHEGLPLLRIGGEEIKYQAVDFTAPSMFAGSLFDLEVQHYLRNHGEALRPRRHHRDRRAPSRSPHPA